MGFMMMANYGKPTDLDIWFGESGERCLVLKYDCPELCIRHKYLMETHNATYDFPDFTPHITLSYDMCDVDIASLPNIHDYLDSICITYEYSRELIVDWNSTVLINKS